MKRLLSGIALLAASLCPQAAALAQRAPASEQMRAAPADEAARVTARFAACLVETRRARVVSILQEVPGSAAEREQARRLAPEGGNCLVIASDSGDVVRLGFQPVAMRGPLAEALYEGDFRALGQPRRNDIAQLPDLAAALAQSDVGADVRRSAILGSFAYCVVAADPAAAAALLATPPASQRERDAIDALSEHFGPCFPAEQTFSINRTLLRGFIAEGVYRHSAALARQAGATQ